MRGHKFPARLKTAPESDTARRKSPVVRQAMRLENYPAGTETANDKADSDRSIIRATILNKRPS